MFYVKSGGRKGVEGLVERAPLLFRHMIVNL